ncbi:peptidase M24, structural domain-containing protein [Hyaloraphidium curvatum]|nr:peptidase M24, structural domain-containing protein [Hyaloraphidium curvatum]
MAHSHVHADGHAHASDGAASIAGGGAFSFHARLDDGPGSIDPATFAPVARDNRKRFVENLQKIGGIADGAVVLRGGEVVYRYNTDVELAFRQESNFFYLSGVNLPDFSLLIELPSGRSTLVAPHYPVSVTMWSGEPDPNPVLKKTYDFDEVIYDADLEKALEALKPSALNTLEYNADAVSASLPAKFRPLVSKGKIDWPLFETRVVKSEGEIGILREANRLSSLAHIKLMRAAKRKTHTTEHELYALFMYETTKRGSFHQAYHPICASGCHAAALHYVKNRGPFPPDDRNLVLIDAGCEYFCYASDITRTWPVGGKYLDEWRDIYQVVYDAQLACFDAIKPGVNWEDIHRLADRVHVEGLKKLGILKGDVDEMLKKSVGGIFMPHGLGHLLGLDVHDVGGYPKGVDRIDEPGLRYLRMRRKLIPGMVLTVEPGIYFIDAFLEPALADPEISKFIDAPTLERYRKVGGVRIEDDIVVTETGMENLTAPFVPAAIDEVEKLIAAEDPDTTHL